MRRRTLLLGAAATATLAVLPTLPAEASLTNTILPGPQIEGGINNQPEVHALFQWGNLLAIGGSFSTIIAPNGTRTAASNAAILNLDTHAVVWAGRDIDGYVGTITGANSIIYFGGRFTRFQGQPRQGAAAITTGWRLLAWNPKIDTFVRRLTVATNGPVIVAGGSFVAAVENGLGGQTGRTVWRRNHLTGNGYRAGLLLSGGSLYAGGMWESIGGVKTRVAKMNPATGVIDARFKPPLKFDDWRGDAVTSANGDCVMDIVPYPNGRLLVTTGGRSRNGWFVLNQATGAIMRDSRWYYVPRQRSGVIANPRDALMRSTPGDGNCGAVIGSEIVVGFHRSHAETLPVDFPTKRMINSWSTSNGRSTRWDPGFAGTSGGNSSNLNLGVFALKAVPSRSLLIVAGAFKGYGDAYTDGDLYGVPTVQQRGLAYVKIG